jgi:hypothetical protein
MSGTPGIPQSAGDIVDGGDLRHADAGDDTGGTDRTGADADLDAVSAVIGEGARRIGGGNIAADDVYLREIRLDPLDAIEHALRMAVRSIDDQQVYAGLDQQFGAFLGAWSDADGSADAQAAEAILAGEGVLGRLEDVLHRNQSAQFEVAIDDEHAL